MTAAPPRPVEGPEPGSAWFTVVVASSNRGKVAEFRALLAGLPIEVVPFNLILPSHPGVPETGNTFDENAILKAASIAKTAMLVTLADDSGLEVNALDGRPGVRSARFASEHATDAENNAALLAALEHVEDDERGARFSCVLALVDPFGDVERPILARGTCEGAVAREGRGSGGFGYDPLFIVDGYDRTMAELTDSEKAAVSHRGRACAEMRPHLERLIEARRLEVTRILGAS